MTPARLIKIDTLLLTIVISAALIVGSRASALSATVSSESPDVRVLIADNRPFVNLYIKDGCIISEPGSGKVLVELPRIARKISGSKRGMIIGDKEFNVDGIRVKASKGSNLYLDNKAYRGDVDIVKRPDGRLMVINHVGLDEYLYGVLHKEVSHRWPMEVLKAQAIVARTFALYQAGQNRSKPYDLGSDIYSQVYGGSDFERWSTTMAVNVTRGKVLAYKGELLPAYYHAACSGATEDSSALWNIDMPPLDGVQCDFCRGSRYYHWTREIPLGDLSKRLRTGGYKTGNITSVTVISRNKSGRVEKMEISDAAGVSTMISGKDFRQLAGPNIVRSTKFDISVVEGRLMLEGRGWGHGVGMCQWGAFGQAKHGRKAEEILKYYYPGAEIVDMESLKLR